MVCFVPIVCLRKSCQSRDCSELGAVRNWVDHCIFRSPSAWMLHMKFGYIWLSGFRGEVV